MAGYIGATTVSFSVTEADIKGDITSTDDSPEVTLQNTTEEDTDGGRESKITFKGEQSGGEISTLAQIQASHDGTADDEKGDLIFSTNDGSDGNTPTERMRIDADGNVGIGTTSPSNTLHVTNSSSTVATGYFNNTSVGGDSPALIAQGGANNAGSVGVFEVRDYGGNTDFYVGGTGNVGINSGNFLVGTTNSDPYTSSTETGCVVKDGSMQISNDDAGSAGNAALYINQVNSPVSGTKSVRLLWQGSEVGSISVTASSTSYNTSSDYRLKENVTDVTDGITRVKQLSPKRFNFISNPDTTVDGFLAHEAAVAVPEAVTGTHNEVDDDNNPVYQGIDQSKLVPLLTAALQEAIAKIETLETKVAALENA